MTDQPQQDPPPIPGHVLDLVEQSQADTRAALDQLILEVEAAKNVPLSNSVMLPREEFIERMRSIRSTVDRMLGEAVEGLPEELRAARWMVREREAYIARTNESAREMLVKAKQRSEDLVSESYIVSEAVEEANTLIRHSEKEQSGYVSRLKTGPSGRFRRRKRFLANSFDLFTNPGRPFTSHCRPPMTFRFHSRFVA